MRQLKQTTKRNGKRERMLVTARIDPTKPRRQSFNDYSSTVNKAIL